MDKTVLLNELTINDEFDTMDIFDLLNVVGAKGILRFKHIVVKWPPELEDSESSIWLITPKHSEGHTCDYITDKKQFYNLQIGFEGDFDGCEVSHVSVIQDNTPSNSFLGLEATINSDASGFLVRFADGFFEREPDCALEGILYIELEGSENNEGERL